jgi:signal transduction histidine kinase
MRATADLQKETRFERNRAVAVRNFLRRFRHEISTPLSSASLHLEVALRRLKRPGGYDISAVLENLQTCQQSLESAAAMLELITDVSREEIEEPKKFSLSASVARAAEPFRPEASERGLALEVPEAGNGPEWFGSPREVERVVTELTRNAVEYSSSPGVIRWTIEQTSAGTELICRSQGQVPAGDPEHLFGVTRGGAGNGRGFGLLRARRAAQGNGGELTMRLDGDEVAVVLRFPEGKR